MLRTRLLLTHVGLVLLASVAVHEYSWAGVVFAVVMALAVGFFTAAWVRRRVRLQRDVATQIAEGDLAARAPALETDEIGRLGQTLNRVAERSAGQIRALTANRDELACVLGCVTDGLVAIDADDRVTHVNAEAGRLFDIPASPGGQPFWEIVRDAGLAAIVAQARDTGKPAEGALELVHAAPRRDLEVRVSPKSRLGDPWTGAVLAFRDVTLLTKLEAVRRDFVANVSHEMKTPLTSIQGYVETLLAGALEDGTVVRDFLGKIERNAQSLGYLVSDLLVLSRVEAGGIEFEPEAFPLFTVVSEAAAACAEKAREKNIELRVTPGPRDAMVWGDRDLLVRAVVNLLDNAIQYTRAGGRIHAEMARSDSRIEVTVTDTGIGIAPHELERIFERFYRVDKARSRALGGTGLGLAIVKHVAERHGGSIRVISDEGVGSEFTFSLPIATS